MKKRRILSAALATIMALGLSVPSYALEEGETSPTPIIEEGGEVDPGGGDIDDIIIPISEDDEPAIEEEQNAAKENKGPWEPDEPKHNNFRVNSLNFYINLEGHVLDTKEGSGHYYSNRFTSALTDTYTVDGTGLEAAVIAHPDYYFISNYYDAIVGDDESDYVSIDSEIRTLLSNYMTVPSDSEILENVKTQIQNGTKINDINGTMVSDSLVSTDYFNVYWYVLKEGNSEWHVDGILEKKDIPTVNTYLVEYNWTVNDGPGLPSSYEVPATVEYAENDLVNIDTSYTNGMEVSVIGGKYIFSGWDQTDDFNITEDTTINGEWTWIADEPIVEPTPASVTVSFQKYLNHGTPDRYFTFTLNTVNGTLRTLTTDGTNGSFTPISFTKEGTYKYTVQEISSSSPDYSDIVFDLSVYDVTVVVTLDTENNKYVASTTYSLNEEPVDEIIFNNFIKIEPNPDPEPFDVTIGAEKFLDGQTPDKQFEFELKDKEGNVLQTTKNNGSDVLFMVTYDSVGTYEYTISEKVDPSMTDINFDDTVYTITNVVTLNSNNEYEVYTETSLNGELVNNASFYNTTKETPPDPPTPPITEDPDPIEITLQGVKYLDNQAASGFTFVVSDDTGILANVHSNDKGIFRFVDSISKAGIYRYTIAEQIPTDTGNIIYDDSVYSAMIEVSLDEATNELKITNSSLLCVKGNEEGYAEQMIFNNTTKETPPIDPPTPPVKDPTSASVILSGEKYLDKNTPSTQFDFILKDSTGKEIETVKNTGKDFKFNELTFNKEGTYQYTISEVSGNSNKIKYDNTVYTIVINVTLDKTANQYNTDVVITSNNADGNLTAIVFNNTTINDHDDSDNDPDPKPRPDPKPDPKPEPTPDPIPTPTPDPVIIPDPVEEPKDEPTIDDVPKTGEPFSLSLAIATLFGTIGTMSFINRKKKDDDQ